MYHVLSHLIIHVHVLHLLIYDNVHAIIYRTHSKENEYKTWCTTLGLHLSYTVMNMRNLTPKEVTAQLPSFLVIVYERC